MHPIALAGGGIKAMQIAGVVWQIDKSIGDGCGRRGAIDEFRSPELVTRFYSTENLPRRYLRVRRN